MFKNYQELFNGCVDFYSASLFGIPAAQRGLEEDLASMAAFARRTMSNQTLQGQLMDHPRQSGGPERQQAPSVFKRLESSFTNIENYLKATDLGTLDAYKRIPSPDIGSRLIDEDGIEVTIGSFNRFRFSDAAHILCIFIFLVCAKRLLVRKLAASKGLQHLGLRPKDRERLDECVWRLMFYSFSSIWLIYTCFVKHESYSLFSGSPLVQYSFQVDWWSYTICMIEVAFYLHATYALVWEDVWRRDSPMMLIHHVAAVLTISSIYLTRLYQIGLASTVLRDTCDVLLEVTKLLKCLYIQHGRRITKLGLSIKFFLTIFTFAFAINQLYYYPLFCLYHIFNVLKVFRLQTPVMAGIISCALVFLILDCLWFLLILRLLYYIVLSGGRLKDVREFDDDDEEDVAITQVNDETGKSCGDASGTSGRENIGSKEKCE